MSFVTTQPEALAAAAGSLQGIGSAMNAQNAAAAAPTTGVVPAAADEVSALTAAQFAAHAQMYQAVSAQAAAIHEMFVNTLSTSAELVRRDRDRQRSRRRLTGSLAQGLYGPSPAWLPGNHPAFDDLDGRVPRGSSASVCDDGPRSPRTPQFGATSGPPRYAVASGR